ncbi:MAG TPA: PLP-dependent aminotransferase family protein [Sedimentisphaerales bacterium]|nr:PLP-dependent aminotransferase family protein [Sedimentisphaerales bacterium]
MSSLYASRMSVIPRSFVREILKVTQDQEVISFAGGLPNPRFFPAQELAEASALALAGADRSALQYGMTEGYAPLREFIAQRYRRSDGLDVTADEILITNGSQQGLDLVGKAFLDKQDAIAIERPAYLGAIQAFSAYEPEFHPVPLLADGVDIDRLAEVLRMRRVKFFHTVINFQNPSGISYSEGRRLALAEAFRPYDTLVVEDDPYKELRFEGATSPSMRRWLGDRAILLGSFSKIVAPGLRMGWVCAVREILDRLIVAKQASDLHSNSFCQRMLYHYLAGHDIDRHIATIRTAYRRQKDAMLAAIQAHFPAEIEVTRPEGGMFVWATLPSRLSALELFEHAAREKVVFVPGTPFFVDGGGTHDMRLNFSNAEEDKIEKGIARLGRIITKLLSRTGESK